MNYPTKPEIRKMLATAGQIHMVQLTIPRTKRPLPGQCIRLLGRSGPRSIDGTAVQFAAGQCTAWWWVKDLREWSKPRKATRSELEAFVARVRERAAEAAQHPLGGDGLPDALSQGVELADDPLDGPE